MILKFSKKLFTVTSLNLKNNGDYLKHPIKEILDKRKQGINSGIASYCTANSIVIESILEYYLDSNEYVLIECTANQVNQFGGYTGMTPADFRDYVFEIADGAQVFLKKKLSLVQIISDRLHGQIKMKRKRWKMQRNLLN